jgi:hypothetical protein
MYDHHIRIILFFRTMGRFNVQVDFGMSRAKLHDPGAQPQNGKGVGGADPQCTGHRGPQQPVCLPDACERIAQAINDFGPQNRGAENAGLSVHQIPACGRFQILQAVTDCGGCYVQFPRSSRQGSVADNGFECAQGGHRRSIGNWRDPFTSGKNEVSQLSISESQQRGHNLMMNIALDPETTAATLKQGRHDLYRARQNHVRAGMRAQDVAVMVICDANHIRYMTGSSNMMLWGLRSPSRYLLAFADGPVILYDSPGAAHLAAGLPTITEVRAAQGLDYIGSGGDIAAAADRFADEILGVVLGVDPEIDRVHIDRLPWQAVDALRARGLHVADALERFACDRIRDSHLG